MPTMEIFALLLLGALAWLWLDSIKAREIGIAAARGACKAEALLFLDETVAIESLRPVRDSDGRVRLRRIYGFEYSDTGNNRRKGNVTMVGHEVMFLHIRPHLVPVERTLH